MKIIKLLLFITSASFVLHGQKQQFTPSEAPIIEAAWASSQRLINVDVPVKRGFNVNGTFEHISTDAAAKVESPAGVTLSGDYLEAVPGAQVHANWKSR